MTSHPRTFIAIGLLCSPLAPAEVVRQQQFFINTSSGKPRDCGA